MTTSSANADDLDAFSVRIHLWSQGLRSWERRLDHKRTVVAAASLRTYWMLLEAQGKRLHGHARAFRTADAKQLLSTLSASAHRTLANAAAGSAGARSVAESSLAKRAERVYLRADGRGDGRIVEIFGDVVNAEHIVFVVPGMTNDLTNYETQLRSKALNLLAEIQRQSPNSKVAVVAWLGYDTPDLTVRGVYQARGSALAKEGATALLADLLIVRRLNPQAHITAVGHSYGSVVLGQAMRHDLDAAGISDVVVVGSPGMDATSRSGLRSPGVQLWASKGTVAPIVPLYSPFPDVKKVTLDPIAFAPAHGEDPSAKGFGARRFSSEGVVSHGGYFESGSTSLKNIGRIALGRG